MARRKGADKFHVGQRCVLVLDPSSGWAPFDGEPCTVIAAKTAVDIWCYDHDGRNRNFQRATPRYEVRFAGGEIYVRESQLRALGDGEELSSWDQFAKATGINLPEVCLVARPAKSRKSRARAEASDAAREELRRTP